MIQTLLFAADTSVLVAVCWLTLAALRVQAQPARTVAFLVLFYSAIVLPTSVLSHMNLLNSQVAHLVSHVLIGALAYGLWWLVRMSRPPLRETFSLRAMPSIPLRALSRHPDLAALLIVIGIVYVANLAVVLLVAQSTNDALAYHLPRILYWLRAGNYQHYETYQVMQPTAPMNSSLTMLWTVLHTGNEHLVGTIQYAAALGAAAVVYGFGRILGQGRIPSLFAALLWLSLPVVLLQSTTAQNDMVAAFLIGATVYLYVVGVRTRSYGQLAVSALALGVAVGTKVTVLLFGLSFVLMVGWMLIQTRGRAFGMTVVWGLCCLAGIAVLGSPTYIQNWRTSGQLLGPQASTSADYLPTTTFTGTTATLGRYAFEAIDTTGLPRCLEPWIQDRLATVGRGVFAALHLDPNGPPQNMSPTCAFGFYEPPPSAAGHWGPMRDRRREEEAWMGPLGALLVLPSILIGAFRWRSRTGCRLRPVLCWMAILYAIAMSAVLPWSPWRGRYMAIAALFGAPLVATLFSETFRWRSVRVVSAVLAMLVACNTVLFSKSRPLVGPSAVLRASYASQRSAGQGFEESRIRAIEEAVPGTASLGAVGVRYEYSLFGQDLKRPVAPVFLSQSDSNTAYSASASPEYIIVDGSYLETTAVDAVMGYTRVSKGSWGVLFCRQDGVMAHEERAMARLMSQNLAASLPKAVRADERVCKHLRFRQPAILGPWGFEHTGEGWFWIGQGDAGGITMELYSDVELPITLSLEVTPGPSRRDAHRTAEVRLASGGTEHREDASFDGPTVLKFDLIVPTSNSTLHVSVSDIADIERLSNGDTRPLLVQCQGVSLQATGK